MEHSGSKNSKIQFSKRNSAQESSKILHALNDSMYRSLDETIMENSFVPTQLKGQSSDINPLNFQSGLSLTQMNNH